MENHAENQQIEHARHLLRHERMEQAKRLTFHYALIQSFFWMGYTSIRSYTTPFLTDNGLSYSVIGILYAVASIGSVLLQTELSDLLDRSKKFHLKNITLTLVAIVLLLGGWLLIFNIADVTAPMLTGILYVIMLIILYVLQPLITSLCYLFINHGFPLNFGLARGIGSVCCAAINVLIGNLVVRFGSGIIFYPLLLFFFLLVVMILTFRVKGVHIHSHKPIEFHLQTEEGEKTVTSEDVKKHVEAAAQKAKEAKNANTLEFLRRNPMFLFFLIASFCSMTAYQSINSYLITIAERVGGNSRTVGYCFAISAASELPSMAGFNWLRKKIGVTKVLRISAFFYIMKPLLMFLATTESMLFVAALMQMGAFGLFLPGSAYFANQAVSQTDRVKAQALVSTATIGLAMTVGSLLGGFIIDQLGVTNFLIFCISFAVIGFIVMFLIMNRYDKVKKIK